MSTAPVDRDTQIELIKNAAERHGERMKNWMANPVVRGVISRPTEQQLKQSSTLYSEHTTMLARCG
ncbi:hypothetical protein [Pseudochrobactrum saccharolyticum]|uniref:Uncharacterized protein n=1 Tax=Pseudochrobactrum saccharolyticum TaxID=354352 RepID=A0A7W8AJ25_9HYPH|nr:hypothetical protein [Pseudochrobactrum saccharolyticum]KAB0538072.1 hypothetical protein F7P81_10100 [Pseudochrobactrum saccharolyticum]MBB5091296.1 hypothetical protein [Pseudochrobactrum saccharolyticum]MDP8250789.1 hypothetical protein [Pseudochrobactrum saccharolyticum]MDP8250816.1 hypothetical protein [Pseudochrobactrum saccharolyticum]